MSEEAMDEGVLNVSAPESPEPEEFDAVHSPGSANDTYYEDAPSRIFENGEESMEVNEESMDLNHDEMEASIEMGHGPLSPTSPGSNEDIDHAPGPLSPDFGDNTIYASASESLISEPGSPNPNKDDFTSHVESLSYSKEHLSGDGNLATSTKEVSPAGSSEGQNTVDDHEDPLPLTDEPQLNNKLGKTNDFNSQVNVASDDPLPLREDPLPLTDNDAGATTTKHSADSEEEGEAPGSPVVATSAYQTEPVSSDDDIGALDDSDDEDQVANNFQTGDKHSGNNTYNHKGRLNRTDHDLMSHEDHVELDYDEDLDDTDKIRADGKGDDDKDDHEEIEDGAYSSGSEKDERKAGDQDCEDGEILDDEDDVQRAQVPTRLCRFYSRGRCNWGADCNFLHPGINDKGNYSLIERPLGPPSMAGRLGPQPWHRPQDKPEEEEVQDAEEEPEEPAQPPTPPREETAWERGLRHAKEMRKLAKKRKEQEKDFEDKKMNLSLEDFENKENHREGVDRMGNERVQERQERPAKIGVFIRDPYYDNVYDSEDDYYNIDNRNSWQDGHYQNFEVRWTRDPEDYPPADNYRHGRIKVEDEYRSHEDPYYERERFEKHHRERRPSPPDHRYERNRPEQDKRPEKRAEPKKAPATPVSKKPASKPDIIRREPAPAKTTRGDEWHDPWQRTKKKKVPTATLR